MSDTHMHTFRTRAHTANTHKTCHTQSYTRVHTRAHSKCESPSLAWKKRS